LAAAVQIVPTRQKREEERMRQDAYEALIVGARVAGSILAALLGEAGARVLLSIAPSSRAPPFRPTSFAAMG
jgi:hypothetical protein